MKRYILSLFVLLCCTFAIAQTTPVATVTDAYVDGNAAIKSAGLSDLLVVHVAHLNTWLKAHPGASIKQLRLFISSLEIDGSAPIGWDESGDDVNLKYLLQRNEANNKTWNTLLGYPGFGADFFYLRVSVSVGNSGQEPLPTKVNAFNFVRIYRNWFWGCMVFLALYFWLLFWCATKTPMLRDTPADLTPLGITGLKAGATPYSLGKVQMAFWFSVVLASYVFIWLITDNYELISTGTLVLIGIGAGTGLSAVSIDSNKVQATIKKIQDLRANQSTLRETTEQLKAMLPAAGVAEKIQFNQTVDGEMTASINELIAELKVTKDNFLNDLLTDANGISFHRLQMVVFTVVLGLVFLYSVWANLTMPDFSATLLTMQGITAGTYLGFKFPEKQG